MMLPSRLCSGAALALCLTSPSFAETLLVTNFNPVGEGSFQAALQAAGASAEESTIIVTETGGVLQTPGGLTYQGGSALTVYGNGLTVTSRQNVTLFSARDARAISLIDMTLDGPGGFSLARRGDVIGAAGQGIFYDIADDADGQITLRLRNVVVSDVAGHGIHVSDCTQLDDCGTEGAPASIVVELSGVAITNVGQGRFDADGLRVDERGPGSIILTGNDLDVSGVGADGIELDEGQAGDVVVDLLHATFSENGSYCDPAVLTAFLPDPPEDDFREFEIIVADLPQPAPDTPDLDCLELELETYEGGSVEEYAYSIDVDDGFDIDEAGPGSVIATLSVGDLIGNFDQGLDFDEAGPGDIDVVLTGIVGNGNLDDAVKLSEAGPGSLFLTGTAIEAASNGGIGIVVQEDDAGDLTMALVGSATAGNDGGELGIEAEQGGAGEGNIYVIDTEVADGIETDGATLDAD